MCDHGPQALRYRTVARWWDEEGNKAELPGPWGEQKKKTIVDFMEMSKRMSLRLCRQGMLASFPDDQQQSLVHFVLESRTKVQFLVTLSCLCVTWLQYNLQFGGACDVPYLGIITNKSSCSVLPSGQSHVRTSLTWDLRWLTHSCRAPQRSRKEQGQMCDGWNVLSWIVLPGESRTVFSCFFPQCCLH